MTWAAFIQNLIKKDLLQMPTNAQIEAEIQNLNRLYPDHNIVVIDGSTSIVEIISRSYYDYRYYGNVIALADDYPEATLLKRIKALTEALYVVKYDESLQKIKTVTVPPFDP